MTPSRRCQDDRGVAAVLFAVVLTALFAVSALAVDVGQAYAERRHDQNTADAAVMSGLVESVLGGGELQGVVDEMVAKVDTTLGRTVSDAEWTACTDSGALARTAAFMGLTPATQCISFSKGFDRVRVQLPDQEVDGIFGPVAGFGNLSTNAAAEAEIEPGAGGPPFLALEGTTKGDFVCLRTGGNQNGAPISLMQGNGPGNPPTPSTTRDPCDAFDDEVDSSTFGTFRPHAYLSSTCNQRNEEVKVAIAVGMDHVLGIFSGGYQGAADTRVRVDGDRANATAPLCTMPHPNTLDVDTGFSAQDLKCALLSPTYDDLCENEYPRLKPAGVTLDPTPTVVGETLSNHAPWEYLLPAETLYDKGAVAPNPAPTSCVIVASARNSDDAFQIPADVRSGDTSFDNYISMHPSRGDEAWDPYDFFDKFQECLNDWEPGDPVLFDESIGESARFGFIPRVAEERLNVGEQVHIEGFLPIYIYRLYISMNNSTMCDTVYDNRPTSYLVHDAGRGYSCGSSNQNVDRLSSLVFACGMVPRSICSKPTDYPEYAGVDIFDFRLVK